MENQQLLINDERTRLETGETITIGSKQISLGGATSFEEVIASVESDENADIRIKLSISGTKVANPPIPTGFNYSVGNISDGYVITDGTNEFVWIPVDKNQKIKLEVNANENIRSIKLYHPDGTPTSYTANGTSYENSDISPTTNGVYVATAISENGKASVKVLQVYSLYAYTTTCVYTSALNYFGFTSIEQAEQQFEQYGINVDMAIVQLYQSFDIKNGYEDMSDYKSSVNTNGGFYIGRYEAGAPTYRTDGSMQHTVSEIISSNGVPVCSANQTPYNYISHSQAKGLAEKMYLGNEFTCTLVTGSAWDRTLGFLTEPGNNKKTLDEVYGDSREWGNYNTINFNITNTNAKYSEGHEVSNGGTYETVEGNYTKQANQSVLLTTGATDRNSAKNIYDISGNVMEWANETSTTNSTVLIMRGSHFSENSGYVCSRHSVGSFDKEVGFRVALFL